MDIYIFSDESGVFDYVHNSYFVFAGLICFGRKNYEICVRKYLNVEKCIRQSGKYAKNTELKASTISNIYKGKLVRSLNKCYKFGVIIDEKKLNKKIFFDKKHKQRYLDYAYKIVIKKYFEYLLTNNILNANDIQNIYVYPDQHTTATNGKYELREALFNELKIGTFNMEWNIFYHPILPQMQNLDVIFGNSKSNTLIRAADIIANRIYHYITNQKQLKSNEHLFLYYLP